MKEKKEHEKEVFFFLSCVEILQISYNIILVPLDLLACLGKKQLESHPICPSRTLVRKPLKYRKDT
jgi:hypothetical protein